MSVCLHVCACTGLLGWLLFTRFSLLLGLFPHVPESVYFGLDSHLLLGCLVWTSFHILPKT